MRQLALFDEIPYGAEIEPSNKLLQVATFAPEPARNPDPPPVEIVPLPPRRSRPKTANYADLNVAPSALRRKLMEKRRQEQREDY